MSAEYFFPEPADGYHFIFCSECHVRLSVKERKTGYDVCRDCIKIEVSLHKNEKVVYQ